MIITWIYAIVFLLIIFYSSIVITKSFPITKYFRVSKFPIRVMIGVICSLSFSFIIFNGITSLDVRQNISIILTFIIYLMTLVSLIGINTVNNRDNILNKEKISIYKYLILNIKQKVINIIKNKKYQYQIIFFILLCISYILLYRFYDHDSSINIISNIHSVSNNLFSKSLIWPFIIQLSMLFNINAQVFFTIIFSFIYIGGLYTLINFIVTKLSVSNILKTSYSFLISFSFLFIFIFFHIPFAWEILLLLFAFSFIYYSVKNNILHTMMYSFTSLIFIFLFLFNPLTIFIWLFLIIIFIIIRIISIKKIVKRYDIYCLSMFIFIPILIIFFREAILYKQFTWRLIFWVFILVWWIIYSYLLLSNNNFLNRNYLWITKYKILLIFVILLLYFALIFLLNNHNLVIFKDIGKFYTNWCFIPINISNKEYIIMINTLLIVIVICIFLVTFKSKLNEFAKLSLVSLILIYNPLTLLLFHTIITTIIEINHSIFFITIPFIISLIFIIDLLSYCWSSIFIYFSKFKKFIINTEKEVSKKNI